MWREQWHSSRTPSTWSIYSSRTRYLPWRTANHRVETWNRPRPRLQRRLLWTLVCHRTVIMLITLNKKHSYDLCRRTALDSLSFQTCSQGLPTLVRCERRECWSGVVLIVSARFLSLSNDSRRFLSLIVFEWFRSSNRGGDSRWTYWDQCPVV